MSIYYVDATTGDNSDTGLTEDLAWETFAHAKVQSYSAGDTIKFKRGETWVIPSNGYWNFTDSGSSGSYITLDAYGTGTLPILDCEIEMVAATWADEGGNVWSTAWTVNIYRCRLDGQDSGTTGANGDIDSSTYLWAYEGGATDKLFVYATEDPSTLYASIKIASNNNFAFYLNGCNYIKFQNLRIHGGKYAFTAAATADNTYIEINDCDIWYGYLGINAEPTPGGGGTCNNFTIEDNAFHAKLNIIDTAVASTEMPVYNAIAAAYECDDWLVTGNTFTGWGHGQCGIHALNASSTQGCNNNIVEYNTFDGTGAIYIRAFGIGGATGKFAGNIYRYNIIKNTNVRCQVGGEGSEVYYNLFYDVVDTPATNVSDVSEGVYLTKIQTGMVCDGNMIYNNVLYGIYNEGIGLANEAEVTNNLIKNNIVMDIDSGGDKPNICISIGSSIGSGNVISNNCFYDADTSDVVNYKGTAETVAEADSGHTEFSSNVGSDPAMTDPDSQDFTLQITSPCLNTGTDVSLSTDYAGNSVLAIPDIGAYEHQGVEATPGQGGLHLSMGMGL